MTFSTRSGRAVFFLATEKKQNPSASEVGALSVPEGGRCRVARTAWFRNQKLEEP